MELDGLFMAIGHIPNTKFLGDQLEKDDEGYLLTSEHTMTNIPGVFAAGDVVDKRYRQAITASGDGARAAIDAEKWLAEEGIVE
jgi:thioredoxin reductase (NADPH)